MIAWLRTEAARLRLTAEFWWLVVPVRSSLARSRGEDSGRQAVTNGASSLKCKRMLTTDADHGTI